MEGGVKIMKQKIELKEIYVIVNKCLKIVLN